jgi:hypothetical protein
MSDNHFRKRHQQLTRCTDAAFEEHFGQDDLFARIAPDEAFESLGHVIGGALVEVDDELWQASGGTAENVVFCKGGRPAVELEGEGALMALQLEAELGEPLTAVVTESETGFASLRFRRPFRVN